jgi:hypothetical protein
LSSFTIERGRRTLRDALAAASVLACKPCCVAVGGGSGGGGDGDDARCCGCPPNTVNLVDELTVTINVDCIGERTITLARQAKEPLAECDIGPLNAVQTWTATFIDETLVETTYTDCETGLPVTPYITETEVLIIVVVCVCCGGGALGDDCTGTTENEASALGIQWSWEKVVGGSTRFGSGQHNLTLDSCSPYLFAQVSDTLTCSDESVVPGSSSYSFVCEGGGSGSDFAHTLASLCVGSAVTIDISE